MAKEKRNPVPAFDGFSTGEAATLEQAIRDAAENSVVGVDREGTWFEIVRIQAELAPTNQWVRTYRVVITPVTG